MTGALKNIKLIVAPSVDGIAILDSVHLPLVLLYGFALTYNLPVV